MEDATRQRQLIPSLLRARIGAAANLVSKQGRNAERFDRYPSKPGTQAQLARTLSCQLSPNSGPW